MHQAFYSLVDSLAAGLGALRVRLLKPVRLDRDSEATWKVRLPDGTALRVRLAVERVS